MDFELKSAYQSLQPVKTNDLSEPRLTQSCLSEIITIQVGTRQPVATTALSSQPHEGLQLQVVVNARHWKTRARSQVTF